MQDFRILFEASPWFLLLCLLAGLFYAWALYSKSGPWGKQLNRLLFVLRFLLVSVLASLLLSPFVKQTSSRTEPAVVVMAVDNSSSMTEAVPEAKIRAALQELGSLAGQLDAQGFELELRSLSRSLVLDSLPDLGFNEPVTDLSKVLRRIDNDYAGRNLAGVVLLTDGIYNQGLSPQYTAVSYPLAIMGIGDTLPKQDINLQALRYNKLVYEGNEFLLEAELIQQGYDGVQALVIVEERGEELARKVITLNEQSGYNQVRFQLLAEPKGVKHLVVTVLPLEGEFSTDNNVQHAYIDVVDGQQKILLVAQAPHPDIKAIRSVISKNQNYTFTQFIPGLEEFRPDEYDLVILHHLPFGRNNLMPGPVLELLETDIPRWYILGSQINYGAFNQDNLVAQVRPRGATLDEVGAAFDPGFERFELDQELTGRIEQLPPVTVNFADYQLDGAAEVLLYQKVGSVTTNKPLLAFAERNGRKQAVFFGDGLWKWRLAEFASHDEQRAIDGLISKLVQYLSAKEDKRKLRVFPLSNEVTDNEPVIFETELYNDVYEPIYDKEISLIITNEQGEERRYTYFTSELNTQYRVSGLAEGVYTYRAYATDAAGQRVSSQGTFTVQKLRLETLNLTADFDMLRAVASTSGGTFSTSDNTEELAAWWAERTPQSRVFAKESYEPLIYMLWLLIPLLVLISAEWFIRKYSGSY